MEGEGLFEVACNLEAPRDFGVHMVATENLGEKCCSTEISGFLIWPRFTWRALGKCRIKGGLWNYYMYITYICVLIFIFACHLLSKMPSKIHSV